jgi:hypothetical protein
MDENLALSRSVGYFRRYPKEAEPHKSRSGVVDRHLDDLDTVLESDSFDELGQPVLTL